MKFKPEEQVKKKTLQTISKSLMAGIFFVAGTIAVLIFSTALHLLLTGQAQGLEFLSPIKCLASLFTNGQHLLLFGCMELLVILVSGGIYFINTKTYQSEMMQITDAIAIPVPVGQNQHGSSWWLKKDQFDKAFDHFEINPNDAEIRELVAHGEDDIKEYRRIETLAPQKEEALKGLQEAIAAMISRAYLPDDWERIEGLKKRCEEEVVFAESIDDAKTIIDKARHEIESVPTIEQFVERKKNALRDLDAFFDGLEVNSFDRQLVLNQLRMESYELLMDAEALIDLQARQEAVISHAKNLAAFLMPPLDEKTKVRLEKEKADILASFEEKRKLYKKTKYRSNDWQLLKEICSRFFIYVENATSTRELDKICEFIDVNLSRIKTLEELQQMDEEDLEYPDEEIEWIDTSRPKRRLLKQSDIETAKAKLLEKIEDPEPMETPVSPQQNKAPYIPKGGLVIGMDQNQKGSKEKYYHITDDLHSLCIGATRSGKSRHLVLQSIGSMALAGESMVLSDPKGELFQYTKPFLQRLGYDVKVIDFKNPRKSDRYNFLQPVIDELKKGDKAKAVNAVWDITRALVPDEPHGEKIWQYGEASVIASSIMSVAFDNQSPENAKFQNMTNVYQFISEMVKPINKTSPMEQYIKAIPERHPARSLLSIADIAPDRTKGSFYTGALTNLRLFTTEYIYNMTKTSDYSPRDLGLRRMALFIVLPDATKTYYPLATLLVSQHYLALADLADERGGRLPVRVNMVLDEFGNFSKIDDFAAKLTVGGGRGIRFNLFLQAISQLEELYGQEAARTIMGNCHTWIYLLSLDAQTNENISKRLGPYTTNAYSLSSQTQKYAAPSTSQSQNLIERPLLTSDEVKKITRPHSLIMPPTDPAIMYAPDLSKQSFNKMYGLGDINHNTELRELREKYRRGPHGQGEIALWGIWHKYIKMCEEGGR